MVAEDQIRTVIRTFRDRLFTEIFPGRSEVPKTLIFAKDDNHAETSCDRPRGVRQGQRLLPEDHLPRLGRQARATCSPQFRNCYNPRIAVTVDMIATGTDIKPLESSSSCAT